MIRIAIDGPGGAGKSSLAKEVAKRLQIVYVDTGALYRTIGVYMLSSGIDPKDEEAVKPNLKDISLELKFIDGNQVILINGRIVGDEIRTPEASMAASAVSAPGSVREFLLMTQRSIAETNSVIMDGRDIGTVIRINPGAENMEIRFDDRHVVYEFNLLEELEMAYAITVHKSQGSEYPIVIFPLGSTPPMLQSRNLFYTAVTRAQSIVILVGREEIIESMVKNNRQTMRYTGLSRWLGQAEG